MKTNFFHLFLAGLYPKGAIKKGKKQPQRGDLAKEEMIFEYRPVT
jgi:hypothetical protein